MKTFFTVFGASIAFFLTVAMLGTAGWDRPPLTTQQNGYRGTGMAQVHTRDAVAETKAANVAPAPADPAEPGEERAGTTYENVQVLKDVSVNEFNRLMVSITEWVSPEQGCSYCHNTENMADDSLYQKKVARRMLEMTQHINSTWKENHVGGTGVTCYTCHRGQPVPAHVWFTDPGPTRPGGFVARNNGQNLAARSVGLSSLPYDTLTEYLAEKNVDENAIRVNATTALPTTKGKPIQDAEKTYGLMIHMSEGLGVNCTFCHNTRAISNWSESTPQRTTAWHGIRMVRDINNTFLKPLTSTFPPNRLGVLGDVAKTNCTTCHNGQSKPLNGAHMAESYPELIKSTATAMGPPEGAPQNTPAPPPSPDPAPTSPTRN